MSIRAGELSTTRILGRWIVALIVVLVSGLPLFSQANQGTLQGTYLTTGGAIAGAMVTVIDVDRGASRPLTTDSAGAYLAANLIPGTYTVRAVASGFQTLEHANIMLEVGQTVRVDLVLQPGQQSQTITVTSEAPAVDTTDVTLGGTISQQTLVSLPMNGRDFKNLMELRPGVTAYQGGGIDTWSSNGTRAEDVGYLIDGLRADEAYTGNSVVNSPMPQGDAATGLPLDAIQEMNTEENPKAEFGWKPGAIVNVGVKSGTNGLHGSGFAFGRETSFDARNYFDVAPNPKQPVQLEQFGGSAGGPIKKDKIFWFADYEGQRYSVGSTGTTTTPATTLLPGGNSATNVKASLVNACLDLGPAKIKPLSAQLAGLNPTTCQVAPTNYTPGPNEALYPTVPGNNGQTGILLGLLNVARQDNGIAKVDYRINDHNSINGMYFIGEGGIVAAGLYGVPGTANAPWDGSYGAKAQLWSGAWNWTPSSTRVNEFRVGYDRFRQLYNSVDANVNPLAYGLNTGQTNPFLFGMPSIKITGFATTGSSLAKLIGPDGSLQILDHFTIVRGNQTYKIGGEFINNTVNGDTVQNGKGVIAFSNLEAFLQGNVKSGGNRIFAGNPQRHITQDQYALFGEDDWRATRKVMLNLGLRWEYNSVIKESNNLLGEFDPSMGGLVQVGKQIGSPYNGDFRDFSPRVGVAWDMRGNGRTVLRAGGSLMYSALPIITFVATAQSLGLTLAPTGNTIYTSATGPAGAAGGGTIQVAAVSPAGSALTPGWQAQSAACVSGGTTTCGSIFPQSIFAFQCGDGTVTAPNGTKPGPCLAEAIDRNLKTPYTGTWTVGVQQAITNDLSLDVSYVGTHGGNQSGFLDINEAALGSGFTAPQIAAGDPSVASVTAEQAARPFNKQFPYLSYIDKLGNFYRSNYAGLQVTLTQRTSHGLSFLAGYSYSHALDNASTVQLGQIPVDSNLPGFQYGNSDFDTRHRLTLTMSYAIPGKKSPAQLLQGWAVNSVVTLQSGQPWSPRDLTNDLSGTGEVTNLDPYGQAWNVSGPDSAFTSTSQNLPCWSGTGGAALPNCKLAGSSPTTAPAPCLTAAGAISPNTVAATNSVGCYVSANGQLVLFPAALGTIGNAGRNIFRDSGFRNWDLSVTKDWKFRERLDAQFRAEIFNILNHPNFSNPGGIGSGAGYNDPSIGEPTGGGFGCGCVTPDQASPNPVLGAGGARAMQLGLKLNF